MPKISPLFQTLGFLSILFLTVISACKEKEPVDLRITTLSKEELAIQVEVAKNSVTPTMVEGLKMEVWGTDSLVKDPIAL